MTLRRDWSSARDRHMGQPCRVCGLGAWGVGTVAYNPDCHGPIELAHTVGRAHDKRRRTKAGNYTVVDPFAVVPLHQSIHRRFDAHDFDLWPHLTEAERAWAVRCVGEGEARRRISGRGWLESEAAA